MKIVWLTGDYVDSHERQQQAKLAGCRLVIEFHFNSATPDAVGGEVWHKPDDPRSLSIARAFLDVYEQVGLPKLGGGIEEAVINTRASWIRHYEMATVLLEPLFVSNRGQAEWIHDDNKMNSLASGIARLLVDTMSPDSVIGLSIGHMFKHTKPRDMGADCALGDAEANHAQELAHRVAGLLIPGDHGGTHLETKSKTYVIISGDTLTGVAARFGLSINELLASNAEITDPDRIITGQVINIPSAAAPPSGPIPGGGNTEPKSQSYLIAPGDTLTAIAARFGISIDEIMAVNRQITDRDKIIAGETLTIPIAAAPPTGTPTVPTPPVTYASLPRGMPDTRGLSEQEKFALYTKYFKVQGIDLNALPPDQRIILGLRVTTSTKANNGCGKYDDRIVVCWSSGGLKRVGEFGANTEPCAFYEDTPMHRRSQPDRIYGRDADGDHRLDLGCLPDGLYQYHKERDSAHGNILRPSKEEFLVRDINHDGVFNQTDAKLVRIRSMLNSETSILFHSGRSNFTGSAGCQTMEKAVFDSFWSSLGSQQRFSYALVTVLDSPQ
jgi:LysM repeat protein